MKMYTSLATIFWFVRQFAIPNPFEVLGEGLIITISEVPIILSPELLNWLADPIIYIVTFGVVGLYYIKGSAPAWGSVLYMLFYVIHIGLVYWVMSLYPIVWLMILIACGYVVFHIVVTIFRILR